MSAFASAPGTSADMAGARLDSEPQPVSGGPLLGCLPEAAPCGPIQSTSLAASGLTTTGETLAALPICASSYCRAHGRTASAVLALCDEAALLRISCAARTGRLTHAPLLVVEWSSLSARRLDPRGADACL